MPYKITSIQTRPNTDVEFCRPANFGEEFMKFRMKDIPGILEIHEEMSDDELTITAIFIVPDNWDRWNGVVDPELSARYLELRKEYCLNNNIIASEVKEKID